MSILRWERPKKVQTVEQWAESYGFDGGPKGGYVPNMSEADSLSWKAKITGKKLGFPQVEIRKSTRYGSQIVLIVNLGKGYNYKGIVAENERYKNTTLEQYKAEYGYMYEEDRAEGGYFAGRDIELDYQRHAFPTRGINIHISTNGPIQMTFDEMQELNDAISEAKQALASLETK